MDAAADTLTATCRHDWRLVEVEFENSRSVRIYGCSACDRQRVEDWR